MDKFEYEIVDVTGTTNETGLLSVLNERGQAGWEAIKFYGVEQTVGYVNVGLPRAKKIIFKRKIPVNV